MTDVKPRARSILVVDDDDLLRDLVSECLQMAGHSVSAFSSGQEALRHCRDQPVDLLITDLTMPDMPGTELADRVRRVRPGCRLLFVSGLSHGPEGLPLGAELLAKPFTPVDLMSAVSRALAGR